MRDWHSLPDDGIAYRDRVRDGSIKGMCVAVSPTLGYAEPAPAVRTAVERAAHASQNWVWSSKRQTRSRNRPCRFSDARLGGFWALLPAQKPEAVALMDPGLVECVAAARP